MSRGKYLGLLHLIVLIFGFTGILGKEISIGAVPLVWFRTLIAAIALMMFMFYRKKEFKISKQKLFRYAVVGILIAAHWITFFESIKVSNVSIALATMASASLFVALFEPMVTSKKLVFYEILLGIVVVIGLLMIFSFESSYTLGITLALISAALAAVFGTLNSILIKQGDSLRIGFYELMFGFLAVGIYLLFRGELDMSLFQLSMRDFYLLLILGTIATAFAFVISVEVMKELSPFTVSLTINLEPVYSIILALIFYGDDEKMTGGFYLGALVILSTLFINAFLKQKERRQQRLFK
jgi:drug/metabolite transporter (DMT)-like permease